MIYVEAPKLESEVDPHSDVWLPSVFLAGGITNCPDWQADACEALNDLDVTVFNPRRSAWDMSAGDDESRVQIEWEYKHLREADIIAFWFPSQTLCPIVLFELGSALERVSNHGSQPWAKLVIGCDAKYERKFDVITQTKLKLPQLPIAIGWDGFVRELRLTVTDAIEDGQQ